MYRGGTAKETTINYKINFTGIKSQRIQLIYLTTIGINGAVLYLTALLLAMPTTCTVYKSLCCQLTYLHFKLTIKT